MYVTCDAVMNATLMHLLMSPLGCLTDESCYSCLKFCVKGYGSRVLQMLMSIHHLNARAEVQIADDQGLDVIGIIN